MAHIAQKPGIMGLVAAPLLTFAAPADAQTTEQSFAYLDANKDEKVALNEYLNFQSTRLAQNDQNNNGRLSLAEFRASLPRSSQQNAQKSFTAFDANKDKALDSYEFLGYHAFVFKTYIDTDKDGFLSLAELAALQASMK